jgi:hypothetical protein
MSSFLSNLLRYFQAEPFVHVLDSVQNLPPIPYHRLQAMNYVFRQNAALASPVQFFHNSSDEV